MGSPAENSPSFTPGASTLRITAVMAGKEWLDPNGGTRLAAEDLVLLEILDPATGKPGASIASSPDSAIRLARTLQDTAVQLFNSEIGDDGKKLSLAQRLARFNTAYRAARA